MTVFGSIRHRSQHVAARGIVAFAVICSALVLIPLFQPGLPLGIDASQHFFRALVMQENFLSQFRLDGWSPYWDLGVAQFQFYSPLLFLAVNLIHLLSFQLIPLVLCFKLMYLISFALLPVSVYWLSRQFGVRAIPAAIASMATPAYSIFYGMGLEALFGVGLITQCFALNLWCVATGLVLKVLRPLERRNWATVTICLGIAVGILLMSHIISSVFFVACTVLLVFSVRPDRKALLRLVCGICIGVLLASSVLWPTLRFIGLRGPETGFEGMDFWGLFLSGGSFGPAIVNFASLLGIAGICLHVAGRRFKFGLTRREFALVVVFAFTCFAASDKFGIQNQLLQTILPDQLFKYRVWPYLGILFLVFSGVFYSRVVELINRASRAVNPRKTAERLGIVLVCILVVLVFVSSAAKVASLAKYVRTEHNLISDANRTLVYESFKWIRENTSPTAVVGIDERMKDVQMQALESFPAWFNIYTGRFSLRGCQLELTRAHNAGFLSDLANRPVSESYRLLKRYNTSLIMTWNADAASSLESAPNLFRLAYNNGLVRIFEVLGHDFRYIENENVSIHDFSFSAEKVAWTIENLVGNNTIVAAIAWHPKWHLTIDGKPATLSETSDHLISFEISATGKHTVKLAYLPEWPELLFGILSVIGWLGAITVLVVTKRPRNATISSDEK